MPIKGDWTGAVQSLRLILIDCIVAGSLGINTEASEGKKYPAAGVPPALKATPAGPSNPHTPHIAAFGGAAAPCVTSFVVVS